MVNRFEVEFNKSFFPTKLLIIATIDMAV